MSLPPAVLLGSQVPTFERVPDSADITWADAEDAGFYASGYGFVADPWQGDTCRSWMGVRGDGKWAATRCGLSHANVIASRRSIMESVAKTTKAAGVNVVTGRGPGVFSM